MSLYRKYRPSLFGEIAGQAHIVQTLKGAISSGNSGHAYLFSGPRGTGKTTTARLFAKAINCSNRRKNQFEPCNECLSCVSIQSGTSLDLIEIDAASNRGIDEIRNIKDSAQVSSSSSSKKVFIIDEVHMLTTPAFNALLKTLEEPPSHVLFILATTEAHKVIDTILSRVQRLEFKKATNESLVKKLSEIAKKEKLDISEKSIDIIAKYSGGSFRDAESALSKLIAYSGNKITDSDVIETLGMVSDEKNEQLLSYLLTKDSKNAIDLIGRIYESGIQMENFAKQFIQYSRGKLIESVENTKNNPDLFPRTLANIIERFSTARNEIKTSPISTLPLELAIIDIIEKI